MGNRSDSFIGSSACKNLEVSLLQSIIEDFPISVIVFDKNLKFMAASKHFFSESPIDKEKVSVGMSWYDIVPDMPNEWKDIHQRCLKGEHLKSEFDVFKRQDGTVEQWKWEIYPWMEKDGIGGVVLFVENITRQKEQEFFIENLNRTNNALSRFAEQCAHDLNAPLRTISIYVDLIKKELVKVCDLNPTILSWFDSIVDSIFYMHKLISTVLRSAQGKSNDIGFSSFSFDDVINQAIKNLHHMIDEDQLSMITSSNMPIIYGCKTELTQIAQNLISNALKYTDKRPTSIEWSFVENDSYWIFSCKDSGMGIQDEEKKKIFREKKRLNHSMAEGVGIGLFHTKRLITNLGGRIWVESLGRGKGSTFFFTIPKTAQIGLKHNCKS